MKKILTMSVLCSAIFLTGCEDLPGQLNVVKNFDIFVKGNAKTLEVGHYKTSLNFKKSRIVATIETANDKLKMTINVPDQSQIPSNGNFELKSAQSGQPFDILGAVQTVVTETPRESRFESCQYQSYENICDQNGCHAVPVNKTGHHYVDFFYRDTNQKMQFDIYPVGANQLKVATFSGEATYSEKIITNQTQCF